MKFTVSGHPGGGSSALSLILCKSLGIKHIRGSEAFRYLYRKMENFAESGKARVDAHNFVEPLYGPLHDKWIDTFLQNKKRDNYLIENDIASFRVGRLPDVCSIFLLTNRSVRVERMGTDGRDDDAAELDEVDKSHADQYRELHGIEWFDEGEIREKHNTVIDNSNMSIAKELKVIYQNLLDNFELEKSERQTVLDALTNTDEEETNFWKEGKAWYTTYLGENGLSMEGDEIIRLVREEFEEEIAKFPKELRISIENA